MPVPPAVLYVLIPPAAAAAFVLIWVSVSWLLGRFGGWCSLAREYAREGTEPGEDLGLCSLSLGRGLFATNYNGAAHIGLGPEGLALWTSVFFRWGHPALLIPWARVERCERRRIFFMEVTVVKPADTSLEILIRGGAGERVFEFWQRRRRSAGGGWSS